MSLSVEKCKKGDPLGFINIHSIAKYQKKLKGGTLLRNKKYFSKKSHSAEKIERGPLVSSGFVG